MKHRRHALAVTLTGAAIALVPIAAISGTTMATWSATAPVTAQTIQTGAFKLNGVEHGEWKELKDRNPKKQVLTTAVEADVRGTGLTANLSLTYDLNLTGDNDGHRGDTRKGGMQGGGGPDGNLSDLKFTWAVDGEDRFTHDGSELKNPVTLKDISLAENCGPECTVDVTLTVTNGKYDGFWELGGTVAAELTPVVDGLGAGEFGWSTEPMTDVEMPKLGVTGVTPRLAEEEPATTLESATLEPNTLRSATLESNTLESTTQERTAELTEDPTEEPGEQDPTEEPGEQEPTEEPGEQEPTEEPGEQEPIVAPTVEPTEGTTTEGTTQDFSIGLMMLGVREEGSDVVGPDGNGPDDTGDGDES